MCLPVAVIAAAVAVSAVAAGTTHLVRTANAKARTARRVGERNATIANQAAEDSLQRGALEGSRVRSQGFRDMAKAKAMMLAQGQDAQGAGINDLLTGMAINIETDAQTVMNNAARQAWGYRNQAAASKMEGEIAVSAARNERAGAVISGIGQGAKAVVSAYASGKSGMETR